MDNETRLRMQVQAIQNHIHGPKGGPMDNVIDRLQRTVKELQAAPTSRANSIAITHLETAILWLQKAAAE